MPFIRPFLEIIPKAPIYKMNYESCHLNDLIYYIIVARAFYEFSHKQSYVTRQSSSSN